MIYQHATRPNALIDQAGARPSGVMADQKVLDNRTCTAIDPESGYPDVVRFFEARVQGLMMAASRAWRRNIGEDGGGAAEQLLVFRCVAHVV